jgi:hypothetical protein
VVVTVILGYDWPKICHIMTMLNAYLFSLFNAILVYQNLDSEWNSFVFFSVWLECVRLYI